jgi:hypothetical protein
MANSSRRESRVRFTREEEELLNRYLSGYRKLVAGLLLADTPARQRFIQVAAGRLAPLGVHEIAFVKWQMWTCQRPYIPIDGLGPLPTGRYYRAPRIQENPPGESSGNERSGLKSAAGKAKRLGREAITRSSEWFNATLGTDVAVQLDRWMRDNFATGKATIYDKAMDAVHIAEPSGAFHRLWDGGHSLVDAWIAVKNATQDDSFAQEVAGYLTAIWKDVVTPMGLPVATIDRTWFNDTAASLSHFGISKHQLADALSYTSTELAGAALGVIALILHWDKAETERAAELAGSLGVSTLCAANPVLGLVAVICFARAFQTASRARAVAKPLAGLLAGGMTSAVILATSAAISGPVWVGLILGIVMSVILRYLVAKGCQGIAAIDWLAVRRWVHDLLNRRNGPTMMLDFKTA